MMSITPPTRLPPPEVIEQFRNTVYTHYTKRGRDFPWRRTIDAYHILVSEVMLQQTQTGRVVNKYHEFLERFPDIKTLAQSSAADVLSSWQGLGYNRRALALHATARAVCLRLGGHLPQEKEQLLALPGIGPYTAAAIRTFAFNLPEVLIETNIRTVYLHEFFAGINRVRDRDVLPVIEVTLDRVQPRRWYQALMDYGARLKETENASRRSAHHRPQNPFRGSRREARGIILQTLLRTGPIARSMLVAEIEGWDARFEDALQALQNDSLVVVTDSVLSVPA